MSDTEMSSPPVALSERPTPEQIIDDMSMVDRYEAELIIGALAEHGYRIVHPDDVPQSDSRYSEPDYDDGWYQCWRHIFADA